MKAILETIKDNHLFEDIAVTELESLLNCLSYKTKKYKKDALVVMAGYIIDYIGIVISGSVKIIKEDIEGNTTILTELEQAEVFAEVFVCAEIAYSPVTIFACEETEILFLNYKRIITTCSTGCEYHTRLVENMLKLIARKNLLLNDKIEILSKRSTREKLLCFFDKNRGIARKFTIPYNREELASYLCVDRSAMSNELSKMRNEGLIRYNKNRFEIL